jgi:murein DD-endopeptidase MepM/ murein hydrolase activator NlpD
LVLALVSGCTIKIESSAARETTAVDSAALATAKLDSTIRSLPPAPTLSDSALERAATDSSHPTPAELAMLSAELIVPVQGVRPSELQDTFNEMRGNGTRKHEALDIPAPRGTPVLSAAPGRVLKLFTSKDGGLMVYAADSADRFVLMYAHLDRYESGLRDGLPLQRGQVIGYVGTTGNAPPNVPHLHFAIAYPRTVERWWTGTPIDPRPLLQRTSAR